MPMPPILFVLSSHDAEPVAGQGAAPARGFRFAALAVPYYILQDEGVAVELASPCGRVAHPDPDSHCRTDKSRNTPEINRFINDIEAMYKLHNTMPAEDYMMDDYAALCLVGPFDAGSFDERADERTDAVARLVAAARAQQKTICVAAAEGGPDEGAILRAMAAELLAGARAAAMAAPGLRGDDTAMDAMAAVFDHNLSF